MSETRRLACRRARYNSKADRVQSESEGLSLSVRSSQMLWSMVAARHMFVYCSAMPARWSSDRPMSRQEFEARFPDYAACAQHLVQQRWPDGFICPVCGSRKARALNRNRPTWECAGCRRQTSVTAGTFMPDSHLPLKTWFLAAHIVATHSNGISALQVQGQNPSDSNSLAISTTYRPSL